MSSVRIVFEVNGQEKCAVIHSSDTYWLYDSFRDAEGLHRGECIQTGWCPELLSWAPHDKRLQGQLAELYQAKTWEEVNALRRRWRKELGWSQPEESGYEPGIGEIAEWYQMEWDELAQDMSKEWPPPMIRKEAPRDRMKDIEKWCPSMERIADLLSDDEWEDAQNEHKLLTPADLESLTMPELLRKAKVMIGAIYMDKKFLELPGACVGRRELYDVAISCENLARIETAIGKKLLSDLPDGKHQILAWRVGNTIIDHYYGHMERAGTDELELWQQQDWEALCEQGFISQEMLDEFRQYCPSKELPQSLELDEFRTQFGKGMQP